MGPVIEAAFISVTESFIGVPLNSLLLSIISFYKLKMLLDEVGSLGVIYFQLLP